MPQVGDGETPWIIMQDKTKPGVETYDYPVYEITESSRYSNKNKAGWAVQHRAGRISSPTLGTFGISYGNWLCEGATISYDGKDWVSTCTYVHSPDGWDTDLYSSSN